MSWRGNSMDAAALLIRNARYRRDVRTFRLASTSTENFLTASTIQHSANAAPCSSQVNKAAALPGSFGQSAKGLIKNQ
jgi:hypothetical protein